jgi:hypothetical protein
LSFHRALAIWRRHLFPQPRQTEAASLTKGQWQEDLQVWAQCQQPHHTAPPIQSLIIPPSLKPAMTFTGPALTIRLCSGPSPTPHQDSTLIARSMGDAWPGLNSSFLEISSAAAVLVLHTIPGHPPATGHPHMLKTHTVCSF